MFEPGSPRSRDSFPQISNLIDFCIPCVRANSEHGRSQGFLIIFPPKHLPMAYSISKCVFFSYFSIFFQDSEAQISPTCEARVKPTLYKMLRTAQEVTTIKQTYAHITMSTIVYPTTVKHSMSLPLSSAQVQDSNDESCSELREVRGGASGWGQGRTGTQKPLEVRKKTMNI